MPHSTMLISYLMFLSDFKQIVAAVRAHERPISFEELHKKLIDYETFLKQEPQKSESPSITAKFANKHGQNVRSTRSYFQNVSSVPLCSCPVPWMHGPPSQPYYPRFGPPPRAHFIARPNPSTNRLVHSGASHHVTADLNNLFLHSDYDGSDDIIIGDGSWLPISYKSSINFSPFFKSFVLNNDLHIMSMKKNLIVDAKILLK